ncbi:MAG: hypothetical protein WAX07_10500 [Candidatus Altiarchaeia archaeon]
MRKQIIFLLVLVFSILLANPAASEQVSDAPYSGAPTESGACTDTGGGSTYDSCDRGNPLYVIKASCGTNNKCTTVRTQCPADTLCYLSKCIAANANQPYKTCDDCNSISGLHIACTGEECASIAPYCRFTPTVLGRGTCWSCLYKGGC